MQIRAARRCHHTPNDAAIRLRDADAPQCSLEPVELEEIGLARHLEGDVPLHRAQCGNCSERLVVLRPGVADPYRRPCRDRGRHRFLAALMRQTAMRRWTTLRSRSIIRSPNARSSTTTCWKCAGTSVQPTKLRKHSVALGIAVRTISAKSASMSSGASHSQIFEIANPETLSSGRVRR